MNKILNFKFSIFKIFILFLFIPLYAIRYTLITPPVFAITPTSSPSARLDSTEARQATPNAELKSKLKALQDEIASKASQLKNEVKSRLQDKAYAGFIKSISDNSLTLAVRDGTKIVTLNEFTEYQGKTKTGKPLTLKNLTEEDYVVALGDIDENEVLTAKKIVKLVSWPDPKKVVLGQVGSVSNSIISIHDKEGQVVQISLDDDTVYKLGKDEGSSDDIKQNSTVIVSGFPSKNNTILATFVYIYPSTSSAKIATPSSTLKKK